MSEILLETKNLKKYFPVGSKRLLHAVDNVNFQIETGKTLGVVGESGCGKSTLGRLILRLIEPTEGEILFKGENILKYTNTQMKKIRQDMQIIMQDPYSSLNPRMTVFDLIADTLKVNNTLKTKSEQEKRIFELMDIVGIAKRLTYAYPHELDGGRRQRVGIARAIALNPSFIVCDEPVSALDVSIQAQTLNLLMDLQRDLGLAYMFITHDLSVVKHISHRIMVMYLGQSVEAASSDELFSNPMHPYTQALLKAIPMPDPEFYKNNDLEIIKGEVASPIDPKPGCRFAVRCPYATDACTQQEIPLVEKAPGHFVACIHSQMIQF